MHGGKAGQTHKGNQHAVKHGIYGSVLSDEEKELWDQIELGKVDEELRLCRLRLVRALKAEDAAQDQPELDGRTEEPAVVGGVPLDDEIIEKRAFKRRDYSALIDRLMGRIESLERTRLELVNKGKLLLEHSGPDGGPIPTTPTVIELVAPNVQGKD